MRPSEYTHRIRRPKLAATVLLAGVIMLLLCSCAANSKAENGANEASILNQNGTVRAETSPQTLSIDFKGVRFQSTIPSTTEIVGSEEPEALLQGETDKPDGVWPRHVELRLKGPYEQRHKDSFFSPAVKVYPVDGFRSALGKSDRYVSQFNDELSLLERIIRTPTAKLTSLPRIPFFDGSLDLVAHVKSISFKNGRGISYVAQFNIEPSLVNNGGLTYVFQGLTSDQKFYVFVTFPVGLDFLPNSYEADKFRDYQLPEFFYVPNEKAKNERDYRNYLSLMRTEIDKVRAGEFKPELGVLEDAISSLEITSKY